MSSFSDRGMFDKFMNTNRPNQFNFEYLTPIDLITIKNKIRSYSRSDARVNRLTQAMRTLPMLFINRYKYLYIN